MVKKFVTVSLALAALGAGTCAFASQAGTLFVRMPDIPAADGHWDFASWDAAHHRVIVSHGDDVLLVDPDHPAQVRAIGKIAGAHASLALPGGDLVLVTSSHDNSARIIDVESGQQLASIPVADDPDATILSPDGKTAYIMAADGGAVSVVDLAQRSETARIKLRPGLEVPVLYGNQMLAVNNENDSAIDLVNLATNTADGTIALTGCTGPTGLAYAPEQGLALSSCANGVAALVDLTHRKLIKLLPIGQGPDTVIWDSARSRFLVPCGRSGTLAVVALEHGNASVTESIPTENSARTAAMDPATGNVFLPAAQFGPASGSGWPPMVAGTFHLVVLSPSMVVH